jgi:hypothetical protein
MRARAALIGSLVLVCLLSGTSSSAQGIPSSSLEGQVLGWIKTYNYKGATLPITLDHRVYSPAQLSIAQLFANWMQASYLPKGVLGDVFQFRNAAIQRMSGCSSATSGLRTTDHRPPHEKEAETLAAPCSPTQL